MYSDDKIDGRYERDGRGEIFIDIGYTGYGYGDEPTLCRADFTSGTTSAAKGVMISNTNLAYNINSCNPYVYLTRRTDCFPYCRSITYESTIVLHLWR